MSRSATLPRRDLWLLPLISVLTVVVMLVAAEVASRMLWPQQDLNSCEARGANHAATFKPNCTSTMKIAEGPWYTNQYNECGFRTPQSCGRPPDGTLRVALLGSSIAEGMYVPYPDTVGARLADDLTRACSAPVEVQNLGGHAYTGDRLIGRMEDALALRPNAVLLTVTPYDVEKVLGGGADEPAHDGGEQRRLSVMLRESRAIVVASHFLFRNRSMSVNRAISYLDRYGDIADYLRPPFSPAWQERLRHFDELVANLSDQAHTAGTPLILAFVPAQAPMVLMASSTMLPGVDTFALANAIRAAAERHGALFVDTSRDLSQHERPELLYYQVDGHLSGAGLPIVASIAADKLTSGPVATFANCRPSHRTSTALAR